MIRLLSRLVDDAGLFPPTSLDMDKALARHRSVSHPMLTGRFLVPGDFDGDGQIELVAAAMKSGIWVLEQDKKGAWTTTNIETTSGGFEHAAYGADLDGDGKLELYVASDDQHELRSYVYDPATKTYVKTVLGKIQDDTITWNITSGNF